MESLINAGRDSSGSACIDMPRDLVFNFRVENEDVLKLQTDSDV
jgi:hypothetical protein